MISSLTAQCTTIHHCSILHPSPWGITKYCFVWKFYRAVISCSEAAANSFPLTIQVLLEFGCAICLPHIIILQIILDCQCIVLYFTPQSFLWPMPWKESLVLPLWMKYGWNTRRITLIFPHGYDRAYIIYLLSNHWVNTNFISHFYPLSVYWFSKKYPSIHCEKNICTFWGISYILFPQNHSSFFKRGHNA